MQTDSRYAWTNSQYAWQLYATAREYYLAHGVLVKDANETHDFLAAKHYNLCHALELTLKGCLAYTGNYSEERIKGFGHKLSRLAKEVENVYGSFPELVACVGFIQILDGSYYGKGYEYPINGGRFAGTDHASFATAVGALTDELVRILRSGRYAERPLPPNTRGGGSV